MDALYLRLDVELVDLVTSRGHGVEAISPLRAAANLDIPLLVVHGELDSNVPVGEARQVVAALRALGRPVEYLELAGEGHDYRRVESRLRLAETVVDFLSSAIGPAAGGVRA